MGYYNKLTRYCPSDRTDYWGGSGSPDNMSDFRDYDYADDAARHNLGDKWRTPTDAEWSELLSNCSQTWTTLNGINGLLLTADNGKSVFFPAAGYRNGTSLNDSGVNGYYWSSSISSNPIQAQYVNLNTYTRGFDNIGARCLGRSVRPVYGDTNGDYISISSITLSDTELVLAVGETEVLTTTISPANAMNKTLTWSSSNSSVATVSDSGEISAVAIGTATITASASDGCGTSASCVVTVISDIPVPNVVDLGLSVKWASFNLGATSPEEYGDYYAWGETVSKTGYSWASYIWYDSYYLGVPRITKYCPLDKTNYWGGEGSPDNKKRFSDYDYADDAARQILGGTWRTPTEYEWTQLINNCTWTWTSDYNGTGIAGSIGTSKKEGYTDKSIFFPAAGSMDGAKLIYAGSKGGYWSSSIYTEASPLNATLGSFSSDDVSRRYSERYYGRSIRPVTEQ